MTREESADALAELMRNGSFDSARNELADAAERSEVELLDDVEALVDELEERVLGDDALRRRRRRLRRAVGAGGVTSDE